MVQAQQSSVGSNLSVSWHRVPKRISSGMSVIHFCSQRGVYRVIVQFRISRHGDVVRTFSENALWDQSKTMLPGAEASVKPVSGKINGSA